MSDCAPHTGPWLHIAPFRGWLSTQLRVRGSVRAVAQATGLPERRIYNYRHVNRYIPLGEVDTALMNAEGNTWQDLYTEDDIVSKADVLGRRGAA